MKSTIIRSLLNEVRKDDSRLADALELIIKFLEELDARLKRLGG